jgi:putative heme-binding domain-containing protein
VASGYEPVMVATTDGRLLTGLVRSDTETTLVIEDAEAQRITIPREEIEERRKSDVSLMPNGLAEGLTPQDFADLIAYLETLRSPRAGGS